MEEESMEMRGYIGPSTTIGGFLLQPNTLLHSGEAVN